MSNLITIIVPVYNVEKYLDRCIESIVNQTYRNLEIILVDDGSPDGAPAICDKWAEIDNRITVIHKQNAGVAAARNDALAIAKGDYIAFVDGDDYCFQKQYETLYRNLIDNDADISMCLYYESDVEIDTPPSVVESVLLQDSNECLKHICVGDYAYGVLWNKLYKYSVVKGIVMPHLKCSQDLPYNYYAFKNAKIIALSNEQLYFYRNRPDATTKSSFKAASFDAIKAREIILNNEINSFKLKPYAVKGYVNSNYAILSEIITNNAFMDKFSEIRDSILKYRKDILFSKHYVLYDKIKTIILYFSPKLYKRMTLNRKLKFH